MSSEDDKMSLLLVSGLERAFEINDLGLVVDCAAVFTIRSLKEIVSLSPISRRTNTKRRGKGELTQLSLRPLVSRNRSNPSCAR
jgi:hypothetical protein